MSDHLVAKPLTPDGISKAFALVSLFDGGLSEASWRFYVDAVLGASTNGKSHDRGIMTVQTALGYIYGLSAHHIKHDLRRGRILEIENFAVADLIGAKTAAGVLLRSLETIAQVQECSCVSLRLLTPKMRRSLRWSNGTKTDLFEDAGYRAEPLRLGKCF